jgi:hypothetical protein
MMQQLGIRRNLWAVCDVDPDMNVGCPTEVPDKSWPLKTPVVPDAIVSEVTLSVEHHPAGLEPSLGGQAAVDFSLIRTAEGFEQQCDNTIEFGSLVGSEVCNGQSGPLYVAGKTDGVLLWCPADECPAPLLAVKHCKNLIGSDGLWPKDVFRMAWFFGETTRVVTIENRTAEGDVVGRVTVATQRHVSASQQKLKLPGARLAQQRDTLAIAKSAAVIFELTIKPWLPGRCDEGLKDLANESLLCGGEKVTRDFRLGGLPVVGNPRSQEAEFGMLVVPRKADLLSLSGGE